jgi:DNA ligase 1
MKAFAALFESLDRSNSTLAKVSALESYFRNAAPEDAIWTVALFSGRRPKRQITSSQLQLWAAEVSGLSDWMLAECYQQVGDLAETLALVMPESDASSIELQLHQMLRSLEALQQADEASKKAFVLDQWAQLPNTQRFLFNKLLTGGFRVGVSEKLVAKALARVYHKEEAAVLYALMGKWQPATLTLEALLASDAASDASKPYPFFLAYPLEQPLVEMGEPEAWQAEWKWDGIRAQLIKRVDAVYLWSRGEELLNEQFPDLCAALQDLPNGTVLDGELLCVENGQILSFNALQQRLGRKKPSKKMQNSLPVALLAYDVLELGGQDLRPLSLQERRQQLEQLLASHASPALHLSESIAFENWEQLRAFRDQSRAQLAEGLMLKRKSAPYEVGRKKGSWWKWKVNPLSIDAVLLYAQKGHGRRANLFTDYTFALWEGDQLVTFAKAYSGLTDAEIKAVDAFIKANTLEKFGPVRTVKPQLVFEIAFEGLQLSNRHKAGVAVRFPRILRWRQDKLPEQANHLHELKVLLTSGV